MKCAACGRDRVVRTTTFMVDRHNCSGEFVLCASCWNHGANDEAWNERITQKIIVRGAAPVAPLEIDREVSK